MKEESLLPCPLCGASDLRTVPHGIECRSCGLWLGFGTKSMERGRTIIEAWNNRTKSTWDDVPDYSKIEELIAAIERGRPHTELSTMAHELLKLAREGGLE